MTEKRTKKDEYNESLYDLRTYINVNNNELDVMKEIDRGGKVYYYLRNGLLHIRYSVTRFVEMSDTELKELRERLSKSKDKQQELLSEWEFQTGNLEKEVKDVQRQKTWEHIQSHENEELDVNLQTACSRLHKGWDLERVFAKIGEVNDKRNGN